MPSAEKAGISLREARRLPSFWMLSLASLAMASAVAGIVIHMVPFLRDAGVEAVQAASVASYAGLASIAGRLTMGALLDRLNTAAVSIGALACAMIGILMLLATGEQSATAAIVLIGFAMGAETDMIAFMTARLFGEAHYGALYGWIFALFTVGYGLSPFLIGAVHQQFGSYNPALILCLIALGLAALLIAALNRPLFRSPYR